MKTLESFVKKIEPKRRKSKLAKFEKEIKELYNKGYRVEQIQEFLKLNGVSADRSYIFKFLKLNKNLNTKKFSFKNPPAPIKNQQQKKPGKQKLKENKALNAFLQDCQKTAENIKNYKEKEDDIYSSK